MAHVDSCDRGVSQWSGGNELPAKVLNFLPISLGTVIDRRTRTWAH
jgi:hypothetical protein